MIGRWSSRDLIEEEGGLNLYGFVHNCSSFLFDVLGMVEGDTNLPMGKDITAIWQNGGVAPFNGKFALADGHHVYIARVVCKCENKKITCDVVGIGEIRLNNSLAQPAGKMKDGSKATWEGTYGHEQMHIDEAQKAAKRIESELRALEPEEHNHEEAKRIQREFQRKINKAILDSVGHSDDPKNPNPAEGVGYPPRPGSPALPERPPFGEGSDEPPVKHPNPDAPDEKKAPDRPKRPLRPLPQFPKIK